MKTYLITNTDNENVSITINDFHTFLEVVKFNDNILSCEIYTPSIGWLSLANELESIERKFIHDMDDLDSVLENFFENHMFANYFHAGIED